MKTSAVLTALLAGAAQAHYTFDVLVANGRETRSWQYIRQNTRREKYMPTKFINSFDGVTPLTNDFRCNLGAGTGGSTQTLEVAAGSELAVKLAFGATMQHPGPAQVYMSKAPGSAATYDGSGDWFKIHQERTCRQGDIKSTAWCTWDKDRITFTIPKDTPDGEYLIRPEHIGLHGAHDNQAEFYYSCVQVKVTGGGNGTPGPTVKIPGLYQLGQPAVSFSVWGRATSYDLTPGPEVWTGGSAAGAAGGNNGGSVAQPNRPTSAVRNNAASTSTAVRPAATSAAAAAPVASAPAAPAPAVPAVPAPAAGGSGGGAKCSKKKRSVSKQF